ncbi:MAG: quercetin 2,3-dioxygenase [Candidatus Buchananbacteria bacterium RIFCSPHIGHO2_02_FULL_39_17]|uniref:Quercetin 2,3-dioxygenase n=1 Tax=Candidatus Buchananbacteria bacterium RIFCSPLOWO2_01_FULL_40_23b TaxID=1797544 RepID=A0A1G1YTU6_9BACT|nr:MAG: quercetin 2,3-dioxygenase [Candidatus Buchananbacteria bacterium RIFCSPHIGHO2_02_FULL_39_17]OGY55781.1 MAG: quercetin 2,3-dioxygenase [Candidatus Buchananbacteria bacterium RIFCSPLOWO2_01_FULL_40_23b]
MITVRKSSERGYVDHGWLKTYHTFSFADYYDARFVGFRDLLVINEDRIAPQVGFGLHGHENMEIITYMISGELRHTDTMGNSEVLCAGDVQRMSAGTGVRHSEENASPDMEVHLLQIWIRPQRKNIKPSYVQRKFSDDEKKNKWCLIASQTEGLRIHQDATIFACSLEKSKEIKYILKNTSGVWIQIIRGRMSVNEREVTTGDGICIEKEREVIFLAVEETEFLLFDLK